MNQRDRLALAVHEADCSPGDHDGPDETDFVITDALLARGVRVVDVETLAAAFSEAYHATLDTDMGSEEAAAWASDIIAALDGRNRTENGTETTSDAEDDDGPVRWIWNIPRKEADR